MTNYQYFIYRIESDPTAAGGDGPFNSRDERDGEAQRMRADSRKVVTLHRGVSVYRADIADDVTQHVWAQPTRLPPESPVSMTSPV